MQSVYVTARVRDKGVLQIDKHIIPCHACYHLRENTRQDETKELYGNESGKENDRDIFKRLGY